MCQNRAWIYCRVGHGGESSAGALKMQEIGMESYAAQHAMVITARSFDVGSGLAIERPGLREIREAATDGRFDVLLLFGLSRLGRDMEQVTRYWQFLRENGIRICTLTEGEVDLSVTAGLLNMLTLAHPSA